MKKGFVLQSAVCLLAVSCSVHEMETMNPIPAEGDVFYASLESYSAPDTKVYVDNENTVGGKFMIFWDEKDQISIFNETTLNQKYEFLGKTGDNAGYFEYKSDGSGSGTATDFICAVYPYQASTSLDDSGVLTLTLPKEQTYREGSFGPGANTMVSTTESDDNLLRFRNVGGYLVFKFYGAGPDNSDLTIKSIKLEGRNGELLSGDATMIPDTDQSPDIEMASTAKTSITLKGKVKLGKTEKKATQFWMVVPPTTFTKGITVTVTDSDGKVFIKETDKVLTIERNRVSTLSAVEVKPADPLDPKKVIYYTTSDKSVITPDENANFGANFVRTEYLDLKGVMVFDGNVTAIGNEAFKDCDKLTDITIPEKVTTIGDHAFDGCTSLGAPNTTSGPNLMAPAKAPAQSDETTIVIPDGVTSIGAYAFKDCQSLTSIIIPDSVTSIGNNAFWGCTNLADVSIPDSVTMGDDVFGGRTGITSVTIPDGTTSIANYAYAGCENLTEVIIPETVTTIGKHAFDGCDNLVSINIPAGIKRIEPYTFAACLSLPSINIPDGVTYIGSSAFESCFVLENISLPSSVNDIGNSAFASCYSLTSFVFPENVTSIGAYVFDYCYNTLTSITVQAVLPPSVTDLTFKMTDEEYEEMNKCPIYVPADSFADYTEAEGWSNYVSRIHTIAPASGEIANHAFVDMGTGLKWATMNVGATAIYEPGVLLAWSDGKAAAENWGESWRLPTKDEFEILMDESKYTWTWDSTNEGYIIESKIQGYVGNTIFLPTTGFIDPSPESAGTFDYLGCYWSSTPGERYGSYHLEFEEGQETLLYDCVHEVSLGVRPVAD